MSPAMNFLNLIFTNSQKLRTRQLLKSFETVAFRFSKCTWEAVVTHVAKQTARELKCRREFCKGRCVTRTAVIPAAGHRWHAATGDSQPLRNGHDDSSCGRLDTSVSNKTDIDWLRCQEAHIPYLVGMLEISPSGASGAGQQNWWRTVWFLWNNNMREQILAFTSFGHSY